MIKKMKWQNHEAFQQMSPKKQEMILTLSEALENKNLMEALPVLMEWKNRMQRENISFTDQEKDMLTNLMLDNLTPAGKQQYEYIKPFLQQ